MSGCTRRAFGLAGLGAFAAAGARLGSGARVDADGAPPSGPRLPGPPPPHAVLWLYTQPLVRPRHQRLVERVLARRAAAHTSAWDERDGRPVLAIGPVKGTGAHWHGERKVKDIARAWPFVAILEYDLAGGPRAFVDWFRRARGQRDGGGFLLDPGTDYAAHHEAQIVREQDDRFGYVAVPDTPSGSYLADAEFALRARVDWQDGRRARKGWLLRFDAPAEKAAAGWRADAEPLVDWVSRVEARAGVTAVQPVGDPERELARLGDDLVLRFPPVPPGITPGTGRG